MKKMTSSSLAVLGAPPAFPIPLYVGRPNIGDRDRFLERVNDILDRRWFTNNGTYLQEFEARIADLTGARACVATCNATVALELVTRALGMKGEVIIPAFTFVATAHALQWQEITPVFADVRGDTYTIDPERIVELITPRTTGIVGVHLWGRVCDVERLESIARERNLALVFDAAHAFGCSHHGCPVGTFGDAEVFSFHATKAINAFEGGAICTNNLELATKLRLMRNFGFSGKDEVVHLGTNGKLTEIGAAMGLTSIEAMPAILELNRSNYFRYCKALHGIAGISVVRHPENEACNYHYVIIDVDPQVFPLTRDELIYVLQGENVIARRYFFPGAHRMEPYRSLQPMARLVLPVTERISTRIVALPTGQQVDDESIDTIAGIIRTAQSNAVVIRDRLRAPPERQ